MSKQKSRGDGYEKKSNFRGENDIEEYIALIKDYELLTIEEEIAEIAKAKNGDLIARENVLNRNLKLVISIAKKIARNSGQPLLDCISEGNFGLMKGLEKFDPSKGYKFCTYATWWIRSAIQCYAYGKDKENFKSPKNRKLINKINKRINELTSERGHEVDPYEVYEEMNLDGKKINYLNAYYLNLKFVTDSRRGITGHEPKVEVENPLAFLGMEVEELNGLMDQVLNDREKNVLYHRFVLKERLEDVGKHADFQVSRERIRQIEFQALDKLRNAIERNEKYSSFVL